MLSRRDTYQTSDAPTDRYGRVVGYAFVIRAGIEHAVQAELLAAGFARVAARVGSRACALELLGGNGPRAAKLGLWASSYYELLNADDPAKVLAEQGHFAAGRGQGGVGTRKRGDHLRELRTAMEHGLHRYDPEAKCA